jgi:tRNA(Arg) A34 adenosine deaminase TadA
MDDATAMRRAIAAAREGIAAGQSPFGAVIVRGGDLLAAAHNSVWRDADPTAHAEVNAIRAAAAAVRGIDLGGCTMFSTCEPCPMCLAAIHWSKIDRVAFGATIADAAAAGFTELRLPAADLARLGGSRLRVEQGPCADECRELFALWRRSGGRPY